MLTLFWELRRQWKNPQFVLPEVEEPLGTDDVDEDFVQTLDGTRQDPRTVGYSPALRCWPAVGDRSARLGRKCEGDRSKCGGRKAFSKLGSGREMTKPLTIKRYVQFLPVSRHTIRTSQCRFLTGDHGSCQIDQESHSFPHVIRLTDH